MTRESTGQIPVVLFAFKRAASTQRVLQALRDQSVRPEYLIAFVDGPPQAETQPAVDEVCNTIKKADWAHVRLVRRERNYGCNANILDGVSQALAEHRRAVILEDDVLPAPHFYEALCLLLDRYAADERVFSVGGFPHLLKGALLGYPFDAILSPRFSAWGWATWADRWTRAAPDLTDFRLPFELPEDVPLRAGDDLPQALAEAKSGAPTYWDLRLALLSLRRGWLHAHTRRALTANIGLASGEHPTRDSRAEQFMDYHCAVVDGAPRSFPPVGASWRVARAVRAFTNAYNQALVGRPPLRAQVKRTLRRTLRTLGLLPG
ncbi:MAG: glycosyltransferase [Anaerolineae bacterium]|nr:glycosyltransferase [Anaerolineae bacterium]